MSGHYCDTCEGPGNEFCAGPCNDCGRAVHCYTTGRCADCEEKLLELAARSRRIQELLADNRKLALRYSISHSKRGQ